VVHNTEGSLIIAIKCCASARWTIKACTGLTTLTKVLTLMMVVGIVHSLGTKLCRVHQFYSINCTCGYRTDCCSWSSKTIL